MRNRNAVVDVADNSWKIAMLEVFGLVTFATIIIQLALIAGALAGY